MAAFSSQHEAPLLVWHIGRHAETGARTKRQHWGVRLPFESAEFMKIFRREMRQGPRNRLEIIDDVDVGETETGAQLMGIDNPWIIGERATPSFDHSGHPEERVTERAAILLMRHERRQGIDEILIIGDR